MERWLEDIRMAIDLAEQSISPNTDLFIAGLPDNSKPLYIYSFFTYCTNQHLSHDSQSCQRMVALSWSQRMNSAAHVHLWSGRVTAETPPCMSAGIATPACQWWTSASLWRYEAFLLLILCSGALSPVSVLFIGFPLEFFLW